MVTAPASLSGPGSEAEMCLLPPKDGGSRASSKQSLGGCEEGTPLLAAGEMEEEPLLALPSKLEEASAAEEAPRNPLQHALGFAAFFGSGLLGAVSYLDPGESARGTWMMGNAAPPATRSALGCSFMGC
jgi:hypothetical protein